MDLEQWFIAGLLLGGPAQRRPWDAAYLAQVRVLRVPGPEAGAAGGLGALPFRGPSVAICSARGGSESESAPPAALLAMGPGGAACHRPGASAVRAVGLRKQPQRRRRPWRPLQSAWAICTL
jgi:hypothetical protein